MSDHSIDLLQRGLDQAATLIAAVDTDEMSLPTPCADWTLRELLRHVVNQDLRNFVTAARGEQPHWGAETAELGDDPASDFRRGADAVMDSWRSADLDAPVQLPGGAEVPLGARADQQIAEIAIHSWDIARATRQPADLDPEVGERALTWAKGMLKPEFRGPDKAFGHEVPVPDDAPIYDRLAGWFGRDPSWSPER
jgi:uncharacterized protein (TIGR03086 family)